MCQERLGPAAFLGELSFDEFAIPRDIVDRFGDGFDVEIPIGSRIFDRLSVRFHRGYQLTGREPAPLDRKLLAPVVRDRYEPAIPRLRA